MAAAAGALTLALALLNGAPDRDALARLGEWLRRGGPCRGDGWLAFALGCGASLLAWRWYFGGYTMIIDGRGAPGFVKATAGVKLEAQGSGTRMTYDGDANVGGKIASIGQRLVDPYVGRVV